MNPSNPSVFARPLFAFCLGITVLAAAAMYASRSHAAGISLSISDCVSYSLTGSAPNQVLTCDKSVSPPASGTCAITANATPSTSAGGSVLLTGTCSGFTPTSYAWVKNLGAIGSNATTLSDTLPANSGTTTVTYTYGLTACTTTLCAPTVWQTIQVPAGTAPPGGGGGGGTATSCNGFTKTLFIDLPWKSTDSTTRVLTSNYGGFGYNDAMVIKLNPPAGASSYAPGSIGMAEYGGGPITRLGVISTQPCDFSLANYTTTYNVSSSASLSFSLQVDGAQQPWIFLLVPGATYYLNVKNTTSAGKQTCPTGSQCNMFIDFYKAPGT